ncbi:MAG: prepilin-type N-terminal cleavage/methylation domain-containing protein [Blastochloris sp.]|nr:prepilin-type N-terminal cleavage/methylation domain-containing protein [Blastochloris sp.]
MKKQFTVPCSRFPVLPNHKPQTVNGKQSQAFSLVELLVSMAILSTLMVLLFSFFEQATRAWQNSEKKVDAFREARAALYYLKKDLEALYADGTESTDGTVPFFYFDDPRNLAPISYSGATLSTPAAHGDALFFISAQSSDAQDSAKGRSDLCAVGYYLVYDRDSSAIGTTRRSYRLLRYFHSSDETWRLPIDPALTPSSGLLPFLQSVQAGSADNALLFPPAKGTVTGDEVIARNVINFQVTPLKSDFSNFSTTGPILRRPAFFDISLTALNLETAQKLNTQEDWHNTSSKLFLENAQVFTLRVAVPQ